MNANSPNITEIIPGNGDNIIYDVEIIILMTKNRYKMLVKEMKTNVMIDAAYAETK